MQANTPKSPRFRTSPNVHRKLRKNSAASGGAGLQQAVRDLGDVVRELAATSQSITPAALDQAIQLAVSRAMHEVIEARDRQITEFLQAPFRFQQEWAQTHKKLARNQVLLEETWSKRLDALAERVSTLTSASEARPAARPRAPRADPHGATEPTAAEDSRWQARVAQGEALRAAWVQDKLLVPASEFARRWGRTRQALDQACVRGELFSLKVGKNRYYPAAFLNLDSEAVKRVNLALKGDDVTAKFMFWQEAFGALGGQTIADAIAAGEVARAEELALGWSEERGPAAVPTA